MSKFTHLDSDGNAIMVDVSEKPQTERMAIAKGEVLIAAKTMKMIIAEELQKGDVLSVAQLAGIMGAKRTPDLIPLCHPLNLSSVEVELSCDPLRNAVDITATCKLNGQTGVEMEALTAVSLAALTVYDMCKAVDKEMRITNIQLITNNPSKISTMEKYGVSVAERIPLNVGHNENNLRYLKTKAIKSGHLM